MKTLPESVCMSLTKKSASDLELYKFWKEMEQKYKVGRGGQLEMSNGNELEKDNKI